MTDANNRLNFNDVVREDRENLIKRIWKKIKTLL